MGKLGKIVLAVSLVFNALGLIAVVMYVSHVGPRTVAEQAGIVEPRRPAFQTYADERFNDLPGADILIIGDSLVEQGRWSELLDRPVANRGMYGAQTAEITSWASKIKEETRTVVVWAGTNDAPGHDSFANDYDRLLSTIEAATDARIIAITAPPTTLLDVSSVNAIIKSVSAKHGATVLDVTEIFQNGNLHALDGLHLNGAGYIQVSALLQREIETE